MDMKTCGQCKYFRWLRADRRNNRAMCVADLPQWAATILRVSQNWIGDTDDATDCDCFDAKDEDDAEERS